MNMGQSHKTHHQQIRVFLQLQGLLPSGPLKATVSLLLCKKLPPLTWALAPLLDGKIYVLILGLILIRIMLCGRLYDQSPPTILV